MPYIFTQLLVYKLLIQSLCLIIFFLALLISANMFKYWSQWLLKAKLSRRETPQRPKSNKNATLFKLFHDTNVDFVSDHFCLIVLVLSLFSLFREVKQEGVCDALGGYQFSCASIPLAMPIWTRATYSVVCGLVPVCKLLLVCGRNWE